jgi:hypothetical protein
MLEAVVEEVVLTSPLVRGHQQQVEEVQVHRILLAVLLRLAQRIVEEVLVLAQQMVTALLVMAAKAS